MSAGFRDRSEAGRRLAQELCGYAGRPALIVLALPRGGVPIGYEVAHALGAPLDIFIVRKLGVPGWEELAMGAIASGGVRVLNEEVVRKLPNASVLIEEARVRRAVDDFGRIVVAMIREGSRRGEWNANLDPYRTATILMGSITHMIITWLLYRRPENLSKATRPMVDQLLRLLDLAEPPTAKSRRA